MLLSVLICLTGPDVLRDIVWSQNMDTVFQSLHCNSSNAKPYVRWSYVSTLSGVLRYFPATEWSLTRGNIDLYDGRSVVWFVQVEYHKKFNLKKISS